jgi:hypothetical protein
MEDLAPLLMVLVVLVLLFAMVVFVSQVQPVKVLVVSSARNCARAGVETLAEGRGMEQALTTAVESAADGTSIDPAGLEVRAYTEDVWGRGRVLICETGYNVKTGTIPLMDWFYPHDYVPIRAKVSLSIEPYKSRWGD